MLMKREREIEREREVDGLVHSLNNSHEKELWLTDQRIRGRRGRRRRRRQDWVVLDWVSFDLTCWCSTTITKCNKTSVVRYECETQSVLSET